MRSLFLTLALLLALATNSEASWTVIDSACANRFGTDQPATTAAIDTTGADLIVGYAGQFAGFSHIVEDSASNTIVILTYEVASGLEYALWYIESPVTSGTHTFTSTNSAGGSNVNEAAICVMALSGSHATAFDVENGNSVTSSATVQTGSITPSTNGQIIITGGHTGGGDDWDVTPIDSGFTTEARSSNSLSEIAIGYLIQGSAAAVNPTWTAGGTADRNIVSIASFKVAAAGATTPKRRIVMD